MSFSHGYLLITFFCLAFVPYSSAINKKKKQKEKKEVDEGPTDFKNISGDFVYIGGIAETENFIYETDQRKSVIVGEFDLNIYNRIYQVVVSNENSRLHLLHTAFKCED